MMDNKSKSNKYSQAKDDPLFVEVAMKFKKFPVVDNEKWDKNLSYSLNRQNSH